MPTAAPRAHVLVVNSNQAMLDLIRDLLEDAGYQISVSVETLELSRVRDIAPDLIVQDLLFAETSETGWQFLTMARLDPTLASIPLILCTGAVETVSNSAMARNLDRLGVRVLIKPFDLNDLLRAVEEVLTAQHLIDQARDPRGD